MVLVALGHPEALVTDESTVYDFFNVSSTKAGDKIFENKLSKVLEMTVVGQSKIIDIARQLKTIYKGRYVTGTRKLITGHSILQFDKQVKLTSIESKCPDKWNFVDLETEDVWFLDWRTGQFKHSLFEKVITNALRRSRNNKTRSSASKQRTAS